MFYTIYKITNTENGHFYIGQHKTNDLYDNYMGSGVILKQAIKKYGIEKFSKEILHIFDNFEDMNNKEIEIVNEELIKLESCMNLCPGGYDIDHFNYVTARKKGKTKYGLVPRSEFNNKEYETPMSKKLLIYDEKTHRYTPIAIEKYDKNKHKTPSSGRVSVLCKDTNEHIRISLDEYNEHNHKRINGGIVAEKDGIKTYIKAQEFYENRQLYKHSTEGMVTAIVKETMETKHIPKEEFHKNRHLYLANTEGFVVGKHKITKEKKKFLAGSITDEIRNEYFFSTNGQRTVFDVNRNKFCNINVNDYDRNIHKMISDKKFSWFYENGEKICDYWGDKKTFLATFQVPESLWDRLTKKLKYNTNIKKYKKYENTYMVLENWKEDIDKR
jgi:hypothetical protein